MAALYKEDLGKEIKRRRKALGLTQADLAEKIPVKESQTVSRWERGERGPNDLEAVARALETTASEMLSQLAPIHQKDRKRLEPGGGTQLDRMERKLDRIVDLIAELEIAAATRTRRKRASGSA